MTSFWSIIVPESVTNICTNPSFESATTGWAAGTGHTLAQATAYAFKGAYSSSVTIGGAGTSLATYAVSGLTSTGTYYLSAWVYVPANWDGGNIRLEIASLTSAVATYNHIWTAGTDPFAVWKYIETKVVLDTDVAGTFLLARTGTANTGKVVYFDAVQFEAKSDHATTYCDGEQPGCLWTGTRHLSTSERSAQSRAGGRVYNLDSLYAYVTQVSGAGMPPITHLKQEQAMMPGAIFQGVKVSPRMLILVMDAIGTSRENLHSVRKDIVDYIKGDAVTGAQPFKLRYTGAYSYRPVDIECVYSGGMDMGALRGYTETITLALTAYDPFFYELGEDTTHMGGLQSLTDANYALSKIDGVWAKLGTGFNNDVYCVAIAPDGKVYFGGAFTTANAVTVNYICYWNGTTFFPLMTGGTAGLNGTVYGLTIGPDGAVYACGGFTDIAGAATDKFLRIVKWNGTSWAALPDVAVNGFNDWAYQMAWGLDGKLYAVGVFTTATGTTVNRVAVWDGTAWSAMGSVTPGVGATTYAVCVTPAGDVIVGGDFVTAGGSAALRVAKWNGIGWSAMGSGFGDGGVYALLPLPSGEIYAGGTFTNAITVAAGSYLSIWNGTYWRGLYEEVNAAVDYLAQAPDGNIWVAGQFTQAGSLLTADRLAIWNGSSWSRADLDLPGAPTQFSIDWNRADDLYLTFGTAGTATTSAAYTAINNGTVKAYPHITIKRTGGTGSYIAWLKNETTGAELNFDEYALLDGETIDIETMPGHRSIISSFRGNIWAALLPKSDVSNFFFLPGANTITCYIVSTGSPTITVYAVCRKSHWGVDGAAV